MNKVVKRLILQYEEYVDTANKISLINNSLLRCKIENKKDEMDTLSNQLISYSKLIDRISDEMSFKDPVVWILYKYYAYKGTNKNMSTLGDLIQHCMPEDYICTKRFKFLTKFVNLSKYPNNIDLTKLIKVSEIHELIKNIEFMNEWQKHEYWIDKGRIAKWENFNEIL